MKYNDILTTNASNNFMRNPLTVLQDLSTITTAGFSTALIDMGLTGPAESVQSFAQQLTRNSVLGDIVGGLEIGGLIALGIFAPELLLEFGTGAFIGAGIGEVTYEEYKLAKDTGWNEVDVLAKAGGV